MIFLLTSRRQYGIICQTPNKSSFLEKDERGSRCRERKDDEEQRKMRRDFTRKPEYERGFGRKPVIRCEECGEQMFDGDTAYRLAGKPYCPGCVEDGLVICRAWEVADAEGGRDDDEEENT